MPIILDGTTNTVTPLTASGVATFTAGSAAAPAITTAGDTNTGIFFPAADTIAFSEGGAERMRIDSAGNVGIGVTPQSWYAGTTQIEIGNRYGSISGGAGWSGSPNISISTNAYLNATATQKYIATAAAARYTQSNGNHFWYNAPSGTAGTTATFTQAMTLNASGNLGLGVTPSAWNSNFKVIDFANNVSTGAFSDGALYSASNSFYNTSGIWTYKTTAAATMQKQAQSSFSWNIAPSGTAGTAITFTQAMALDASGNLQFNSGYGSVATAYGCRAWVNFNGTGTVAIRASGNISSITDNGTGDYTLNFTTAMSDENYAVSSTNATLNANLSYYAVGIRNQNPPDTKSTTALRIQCGNSATGGAADSAQMNVVVFR